MFGGVCTSFCYEINRFGAVHSESDDLVSCLGRDAGKMKIRCGAEIDLPLEGEVPAEFSITKNYPEKKWSADSSHIKYRLDNNKDFDTIQNDVLDRMFQFNKPYLQACSFLPS